ncbi:MAG: hypothetical protein HDT26_10165 [Subdoligranulum sp.]|nr:hypothetical protein [Subdoligranulum sp.]
MRGHHNESHRIALAGVFGALSLTFMLVGGILPLATFAAPAIAGILIMPVAIEFGRKTGWLLYAAIGLLSLLLVSDREMSLIFLFFFGFYPLLKTNLERLHTRAARCLAKFAVFNLCVVGMYALILLVFPIPAISSEFAEMGWGFAGVLLAAGNATFAVYDAAVARLVSLYCTRLRPRLIKMH